MEEDFCVEEMMEEERERSEPFYITMSVLSHLHRFDYDIAKVLLKVAIDKIDEIQSSTSTVRKEE